MNRLILRGAIAALAALAAAAAILGLLNAAARAKSAASQERIRTTAAAAYESREPLLAEQPEHTRPFVEYRGNTFIEGEVLTGELTFYCGCTKCCGKGTQGITADDTRLSALEPGVYIAGANWLPLGSLVRVGGVEYRIADRGGPEMDTVGRLDIYDPAGHADALEKGRVKGVEIAVVSIAK